jgi:hypothetical protein
MERKQRKNAPLLVSLVLLPYIVIRMVLSLLAWAIDVIAEGFETLGPRFQGFVFGFFGAVALFIFALNLAIWG